MICLVVEPAAVAASTSECGTARIPSQTSFTTTGIA